MPQLSLLQNVSAVHQAFVCGLLNALNPHRNQRNEFTQNPMKASVMNRDAFCQSVLNSKLKILMPPGYPCDKILMTKKVISCPSSSNVKEFAHLKIFHLSLKLCKRILMIVYNIQPVQHMTNSIHIRCKTRSLWGQICNFLGSPICSVSGTCYPNPEFLISVVRWTDRLESQSCQNVVARTQKLEPTTESKFCITYGQKLDPTDSIAEPLKKKN